ncbi:MAG: tetratricopeptide repeat protein [Thermoguttaceae bacterium]
MPRDSEHRPRGPKTADLRASPQEMPPPGGPEASRGRRKWLRWAAVSCGLVLLVGLAYGQVGRHEFVLCDDDEYIYRNPVVLQGLTQMGISWALWEPHAANWHPLTWMSHMLDWQCFGPWAGGHHLESAAIHAASAVLLFLALRLMTGALWPSAAVAALFAVHPLRVESVAWACERKDVLSGLFWMLTLLSYGWYARRPMGRRRTLWVGVFGAWAAIVWLYILLLPLAVTLGVPPGVLPPLSLWAATVLTLPALVVYVWISSWRHLLVFLALAAGLMAKPMVVTLPFVLLLLDYWPLRRWMPFGLQHGKTPTGSPGDLPRAPEVRRVAAGPARRRRTLRRPEARTQETRGPSSGGIAGRLPALALLAAEKMPFFAMAALTCVMEVQGQEKVHVMSSLETMSMDVRVANAFVSYATYLGKTFWPVHLAVFYPHPGILGHGMTWSLLNWGIGAGLLLAAVTAAVLWTTRRRPYAAVGWFWFLGTLVPVIGLVQVGTQGLADRYAYLPTVGVYLMVVWGAKEIAHRWPPGRIVLALAAPVLLGALAVTTWVQVAHWRNTYTLFEHAVAVTRDNYFAYNHLGREYYTDAKREDAAGNSEKGAENLKKAAENFKAALKIYPAYDFGNNNLGVVCVDFGNREQAAGRFQQAAACFQQADSLFQQALASNASYADVCNNLGSLRLQQGRFKEALDVQKRGVDLRPDIAPHWCNLADIYRNLKDFDHAASALEQALRLDPDSAQAYFGMGQVREAQGRSDEAVACFERALRARPSDANPQNALAIRGGAHRHLALLYAQAGDAAKAQQHHQQALQIQQRLQPGSP